MFDSRALFGPKLITSRCSGLGAGAGGGGGGGGGAGAGVGSGAGGGGGGGGGAGGGAGVGAGFGTPRKRGKYVGPSSPPIGQRLSKFEIWFKSARSAKLNAQRLSEPNQRRPPLVRSIASFKRRSP